MIETNTKLLYNVKFTNEFKKNYKKIKKQGKSNETLKEIIIKLANKEHLEEKYRNHLLTNSKYYKNCGECHIEPDLLLIYQYHNEELILLLVTIGSHSELF